MNRPSNKFIQDIEQIAGPIAVFGAGGFIGANLAREIARVRNDVIAITHQSYIPWRLGDFPSQNIHRCDVRRRDDVTRLFNAFRFKTIFYFAAYGAYSRQTDSERIYSTNFLGLLNVLEVAESFGFQAFVNAGSSSEYGFNCTAPKESDAVYLPNSHYAVSKIASASLINYFGQVKKLPVVNLRLYSIYGPYEELDRLIPNLLRSGLEGRYPPFVDPDISRDFVYVDDAVAASFRAAVVGVKNAPGASINIASGVRTTIRQIATEAREIFSLPGDPTWGSMTNRSWDLRDWYGDASFAKAVLAWSCTTPLREGLLKTLAWLKERTSLPALAVIKKINGPVRLSAVIACYKDAEAIPIMYERLRTVFNLLHVDYEIIFVNDCSPDHTDTVLQALTESDANVISIEHSRNFGSQSAFLSGMSIATGDAVALLDGDLQDPPEVIAEMYEKWLGGYEVIYARRVKRITTLTMAACYKLFYRVFRRLSYVPIPLDAGDFCLMDRKVVAELIRLPETDQFLRGLRAWVGFKQTGVDYVRPERMFGTSTNNFRRNLWWARKAIFSFSFAPLEMMTYLGLFITGLSFLAMLCQIAAKVLGLEIPHGITTIIVLILFFGGIQLLSISVIGEYIGKILEETKRRPKFIRRAIRSGGLHLKTADDIDAFVATRSVETLKNVS